MKFVILFCSVLCALIASTTETFINTGPSLVNSLAKIPPGIPPQGCPLCDSSVYTYCSNKMIHDSCCCNGPLGFNGGIGFNCPVTNCAYLHANSCYEHSLITNCCCNSPYRK
ncbi:uncharacterized protein LOC119068741 [Bradysia coprophila]|uniref:uncharacterized protein LOC119068741 n=1 Tax=Bradysia coprophila TaxID=38358 RepID=UPI00187D7F46|nr:uncharacterized protein LOC119068741 [Bradysia coprophila]